MLSEPDSDEQDLGENELEETLQALYSPGFYAEGEDFCLELLEDIHPDWEPARQFLVLNLAAQNLEEEAIEMVDELSDESLFEVLKQLAFGAGTDAESVVYEDIVLCIQQRGLTERLETYFKTPIEPLLRWAPLKFSRQSVVESKTEKPVASSPKKRVLRKVVRKVRRTRRRRS